MIAITTGSLLTKIKAFTGILVLLGILRAGMAGAGIACYRTRAAEARLKRPGRRRTGGPWRMPVRRGKSTRAGLSVYGLQ
jgi:hypothetical protein